MPQVVYIGIKGTIVALDRMTGAILWETKLKGSSFVTVHLDRDRIFGYTYGELFSMYIATGALLWQNKLPGMGMGLISIATVSGSTSVPAVAKQHQDDAAASSAG